MFRNFYLQAITAISQLLFIMVNPQCVVYILYLSRKRGVTRRFTQYHLTLDNV